MIWMLRGVGFNNSPDILGLTIFDHLGIRLYSCGYICVTVLNLVGLGLSNRGKATRLSTMNESLI